MYLLLPTEVEGVLKDEKTRMYDHQSQAYSTRRSPPGPRFKKMLRLNRDPRLLFAYWLLPRLEWGENQLRWKILPLSRQPPRILSSFENLV